MKRLILLMLAFVFLFTAACGNGGGPTPPADTGAEVTALPDPEPMEEAAAARKIIIIARRETNHIITELIDRFNAESPDYVLMSRSYAGEDGETQLHLDILSGQWRVLMASAGSAVMPIS